MSLLKLPHLIARPLPTFTQTLQIRLIHQSKPGIFHQLSKPTTLLTQRSVSLRTFSTENEKQSFKPDGPATFFGIIGGLGYIYITQNLISYFFEK